MTQEPQKPDPNASPDPKPEDRENILLNWLIMLVGLGVITLVAIILPDVL